ncbi:MAG: response regulator, partial [Pirellulales bacterium]
MSKRVLLCDDEIHILRAAELKVRRSGYDVRIARDGQEAWEMIQTDLPDVLVTDVQMP